MIDLHSHILPGLDHGARDWDESLKMCRIAVADGITIMAATPHVSDAFPNTAAAITAVVDELKNRLSDAALDLEIVVGGDYHIEPAMERDTILTLNGNGRYFLLEFPYHVLPHNSDLFVEGLVEKGLVPIVTHPERIYALHGNEYRLEPLIEKGALVQITAASLTGEFGPECARSAGRMLKKGWAHLLATDAHWADERPPILSEAFKTAARILGVEAALKLVEGTPRAILEGRDV